MSGARIALWVAGASWAGTALGVAAAGHTVLACGVGAAAVACAGGLVALRHRHRWEYADDGDFFAYRRCLKCGASEHRVLDDPGGWFPTRTRVRVQWAAEAFEAAARRSSLFGARP